MILLEEITGLILAGGRGMRMGQINKGLQQFNGQPLVAHILSRLAPQVGSIIINANQDTEAYSKFHAKVFPDAFPGYAGPLAGLHSGLSHCQTPYLVSAPCDSPFLPTDLVERLAYALQEQSAQVAVVTTMEIIEGVNSIQAQPVFSLVDCSVYNHLDNFLSSGGRKVSDWYASLRVVEVLFEDAASFRNINTLADLQEYSDK
ncbi:MAG: molybdenum cofactor guanylyltransferase MobA [Undibacterium sp.]|nr:molybdenum cofactor guanylyltransferase MobA [Undibacterium sp.]